MILDIQYKIKENPSYISYLRNNSYWYKNLTRNPKSIKEFINDCKLYNRKIKTERITNTINYIEMLSSIMSSLK